MPDIKFEPESHTYWVEGERKPSVTQILQAEGFMGNSDFYTEEARTRGDYVHQICHMVNMGTLDLKSVDPLLMGYYVAYDRFLKESGFISTDSEVKIYNPSYGYCGTVDAVGMLTNHLAVIDIKTGTPERWHEIQTAAYGNVIESIKTDRPLTAIKRFGLYLRSNGTYRLEPHTNRTDIKVFLSALTVYNWKQGGRQ